MPIILGTFFTKKSSEKTCFCINDVIYVERHFDFKTFIIIVNIHLVLIICIKCWANLWLLSLKMEIINERFFFSKILDHVTYCIGERDKT